MDAKKMIELLNKFADAENMTDGGDLLSQVIQETAPDEFLSDEELDMIAAAGKPTEEPDGKED